MNIPVVLPDLGTADAPVRLSLWLVGAGEYVAEGDRLVEVLWGAAAFSVPAPASGVVVPRMQEQRPAVYPGDLLGWIRTADDAPPTG